MPEVNGITVPFIPILNDRKGPDNSLSSTGNSFDIIFKKELSKLKFSGHAIKRLETRNIELSETELNRIENAVQRAETKGAKDSLVIMNEKAFIINIQNKTVVTAMKVREEMENIFTNIDSVVFT